MNMEMLIVLTLIVIAGLLAVIYYLIKNRENNHLDGYSSKIDELKSTIDDFKNQNANQQASLRESVHDMYTLLTKGSSKKIGQFGEITLRKIIENAGLKEGIDFDEDKQRGSERPDYVIKLPEGRKIVIDSKVSTSDYAQYLKAENQNDKDVHKKAHIGAVMRHIKSLSKTEYRTLFGNEALDLIVMFMPIEGAYILACEDDLIEEAFRNKIAIVGPTTLIAVIQIILRTWNNKKQGEATQKIIKLATEIYDQTRLVGESFCQLEEFFEKSRTSINDGRKRTEKLVNKVENFRKIGGLEPTKDQPEKLVSIRKND